VTLVFVVAGNFFLQIFHISLPALKIAGGIILLLVALHMVMGGSHEDESEKPKALSPEAARGERRRTPKGEKSDDEAHDRDT
jgi:small neutral amino acid transporter SnatA (MarC family)